MVSLKVNLVFLLAFGLVAEAGVIKDIFNKVTAGLNQTEDSVRQSVPLCGNSVFSSADEKALSPEIILVTNRPSRGEFVNNNQGDQNESKRKSEEVNEVATEFRFHVENVTLQELEQHGFNRDAPTTFLMHGFTSGYPLQAWISAIVEAYTIDRETLNQRGSNYNRDEDGRRENRQRFSSGSQQENGQSKQVQNLFVVNWNYAARGIVYPRAVANIPIVATYVTRFINEKIIDEAGVEPGNITLVGHSLGAHLAGFIGKNTRSKLGRIYGLDPAGPCFGTLSGTLYPGSKRLAPSDADEVITIHTNSALLGIDKPLGRYSIFVDGGANQPGCKNGGVLKSLHSLTSEGADQVSCSHSRAPNLFTYKLDQSDEADQCQLVAYECKDWDSFYQGHCGVCEARYPTSEDLRDTDYPKAVQCKRIGLDWQYSKEAPPIGSGEGTRLTEISRRPSFEEDSREYYGTSSRRPKIKESASFDSNSDEYDQSSPTRRPSRYSSSTITYEELLQSSPTRRSSLETYENLRDAYDRIKATSTQRPYKRERRLAKKDDKSKNSTEAMEQAKRAFDDSVKPISMFIRTSDTQPHCVFQYQVVLRLNEPFKDGKQPSMSLILQDSQSDSSYSSWRRSGRREQNSLTYDDFGNKYNERTYTDLLTSYRRLKKVDHATMLFKDGLPDGEKILKSLSINYMSNIDPYVRRRFSTRLCLVKKHQDSSESQIRDTRFYFEPCEQAKPLSTSSSSSSSSSWVNTQESHRHRSSTRRPSFDSD